MLKSAVVFAKRVVPESVFNPVFDVGFVAYKGLLRFLYSRHVLRARWQGDNRRVMKHSAVLKVMPYSLVGSGGLEATWEAAYGAEEGNLSGSFVECGVAQGGSAALMSLIAARFGYRRHIWLFDSFEGLPAPGEDDFVNGATGHHLRELPPGSCLGTQEQVEALLFDRLTLDRGKITLVKGWFENTLAQNAARVGPIALLRIDADWYESVKSCLENLYDRVVPHGAVIIDDYGTCFGAKKALDEFLSSRRIEPTLIPDGRGGVLFQKL